MFQLKKRILIIVNLVVFASSVCWTQLPQIRTGTFQPITSLTSPSSNITTYTIRYNTTMLANPAKWGLGIVGYKSYLTTSFSFNVTVNSWNDTSLTLTVRPEDSTYMISLRMMYIVSNFTTNTTFQIIQGCFKCLNISQDVNLTTYTGSRNQSFYQNSFMGYHSSIESRVFLYSFNYSNRLGQTNHLQVSTVLIANASYKHTVFTTQFNNINYVCITVVSWRYSANQEGNGTAAFFDSYNLDNTNLNSNLKSYNSFACDNLFFMGIYGFSHLMGGQRVMGIYPDRYSTYRSISNFDSNIFFLTAKINAFYIGFLNCSGMVYVSADYQCAAVCSGLTPALVNGTCQACNVECATCNTTQPSMCFTCRQPTTRQTSSCTCKTNYYNISNDKTQPCVLCTSLLQYCANCTNLICINCIDSSFVNVNGTCYCKILNNTQFPTYLVTGVCLTFPGCVNATIVTNARYCRTCNTSAFFQMAAANNLTCVCQRGYNNNGTNKQLCVPDCGDGTLNNQDCDDGRRDNGDGCNQNCTVEIGWVCLLPAGTSGPSSCIRNSSFINSSSNSSSSPLNTPTITYLYAERVVGTNTAYLYFVFSPLGTGMTSTAFQNAIQTDAPISTLSSNYDNITSRITLLVTFTDHMQANQYYFLFSFTSAQYYFTDPINVTTVTTTGINQQLILISYGPLVKTIQYVIIGTAFLGLGIGMLSAIVGYKLMGLQLLLPMQTGFFTAFGLKNPPPYVSTLKGLKYSLGYNQLVPYNYQKYVGTNSKFAKYDFQIEMALNLNVMAAVLMLATVILLILQIIYLYKYSKASQEQKANAPPPVETKKNSKNKKEEKVVFQVKEEGQSGLALKCARQNRNVFVNNFFFYIAAMISQQAIFCFLIQCSQFGMVDFYLSEDLNMMTGYLVLLLMLGNLIFLLCQMSEKKDRRIITFQETRVFRYPIYLIITSILITLTMGLTLTFSYAAYISAALSFLPLIGLIYFRPYRHEDTKLNAFSAFINLAFPLVASATYLANNIMNLPQMGWLLSVAVIMVWQFATETTMIIRMVKTIPWKELPLFQKCSKKKKKDENLLDKNRGDVEMTSMMKNSIKGQGAKIVDWQEKNKKEYESISQKPDNDDQQHASDHNQEEDELAQLKRRLKKEIMMKKAY